jgi:hypothetical protein
MNLSFLAYATHYLNFSPPISALAVAKPMTPPISLRKVMAQAAPYPPDLSLFGTVDNSNNPNEVAFFWADDANLPPWDQTSDNPARHATSWTFQLWEAANNASLVNATIGFNEGQIEAGGGRVQYDYIGGLVGNYLIEITAYNSYGSSSTGRVPVSITLPFNPALSVSRSSAHSNSFVLKGSGFQPSTSVSFEVDGGATYAYSLSPPPPSANVAQDGTFTTPAFSCQSLCTQVDGGSGGGGGLRFDAKVSGVVVAQATSTCVAT